ncbi:MAG: metal-dependent hydrolase [Gemmatimonadales bacterium]
MFIGHFALGLAAKRAAPQTSLATLFLAPTLADLLWPLFLLLGWEQARVVPNANPFLVLWLDNYPLSHSLLMLVVWGTLIALLYRRRRTATPVAALTIGVLVLSHWVLDVITHRPDMPWYPGSPEVGLGLWRSVSGTLVVEGALFAVGTAMYTWSTRPRDRIGRYGFWVLVAVLLGSYVGSLFAPPPPSVRALAVGGLVFGGLFVLFAGWVDRHRHAAVAPLPPDAQPT